MKYFTEKEAEQMRADAQPKRYPSLLLAELAKCRVRLATIGRATGLSAQNTCRWFKGGRPVPKKHIPTLEALLAEAKQILNIQPDKE